MLFVLAAVLAAPFLIALFLPTDLAVEREVVINRPRQEVFDYLRHLKNQEHYSHWAQIDPAMKKEFRGTDGTVGFVAAWDSDNPEVGKSEHEITSIQDGERIDVEVRFREPFVSTNPIVMTTEAVADGQTRVTTGYSGKMPYPMNLLCGAVRDRVAAGMEASHNKLKVLLEQR